MPDSPSSLGELLFGYRVAAGLSQEDLADLARVSVRAICDLERGATRRPQRATIAALVRALGLTSAEAQMLESTARRTLPAVRRTDRSDTRLPSPITSFVGRETEVADLMRLLGRPGVRLVTLTGPGGVGKTRLALEVAWRLTRRFDRIDHVDLAPLTAASDVASTVAVTLGVGPGRPASVASAIDAVGSAHRLLLVDNVEHVTAAAGDLGALLAGCRGLTILATGRSPLRLLGEHLRPVSPMPLPGPQDGDLEALRVNPAVALLVERAATVRAGFALDARNAGDLVALVRRLDGLPLAIELAAAQLRTADPHLLLSQLVHDLEPGLRAEAVDVPDRHRTLRATVEWSARRLTTSDRAVFATLGAFAGSADPRLLATVLADAFGDGPGAGLGREVSAHLAALAGAALLTSADDARGRVHVHLLETVRAVAAGMLEERGPAVAHTVRTAHARALLGLLRGSSSSAANGGYAELDVELDNLRTALDRVLVDAPEVLVPEHVTALLRYLVSRSRLAEARRRSTVIATAPGVSDAVRAAAWHGCGVATNEQRDHVEALACAERAVALFDRLGDHSGAAAARTLAGAAHRDLGRLPQARAAWEAALACARRAADESRILVLWTNLGRLAQDIGEHDVAADYHRRSRAAKRRRGDERGVAVSDINLGCVSLDCGDWATAQGHLQRALAAWRRLDEPWTVALTLACLSEAELGLGDVAGARAAARQAEELARAVGHRSTGALAASRLADLTVLDDDPVEAARLYTLAMEGCQDASERLRATERLALALAMTGAPDGARRARRLLADAARRRHEGGFFTPVPQQEWIARAEALLAGGSAPPTPVSAGAVRA